MKNKCVIEKSLNLKRSAVELVWEPFSIMPQIGTEEKLK